MREFLVRSDEDDVLALLIPSGLMKAVDKPSQALVFSGAGGFHDEAEARFVAEKPCFCSSEKLFCAAVFHRVHRKSSRCPLGEDGRRLPEKNGIRGAVLQSRVKGGRRL